jgi:hypothetical protein
VRHFGGLASGMGASSHTACEFGDVTFSLMRVELVSPVFVAVEEESSNGKDAGGTSNSELIDRGVEDLDVIHAVSTGRSLGIEE